MNMQIHLCLVLASNFVCPIQFSPPQRSAGDYGAGNINKEIITQFMFILSQKCLITSEIFYVVI